MSRKPKTGAQAERWQGFGAWLQRQRKAAMSTNGDRITQDMVAEACGMSVHHYRKIEAGTSGTTPDALVKIASYLRLNVGTAFEQAGFSFISSMSTTAANIVRIEPIDYTVTSRKNEVGDPHVVRNVGDELLDEIRQSFAATYGEFEQIGIKELAALAQTPREWISILVCSVPGLDDFASEFGRAGLRGLANLVTTQLTDVCSKHKLRGAYDGQYFVIVTKSSRRDKVADLAEECVSAISTASNLGMKLYVLAVLVRDYSLEHTPVRNRGTAVEFYWRECIASAQRELQFQMNELGPQISAMLAGEKTSRSIQSTEAVKWYTPPIGLRSETAAQLGIPDYTLPGDVPPKIVNPLKPKPRYGDRQRPSRRSSRGSGR